MKTKKFNKKLTLSKQTITNLSSITELSNEQKEKLIGGLIGPFETYLEACASAVPCETKCSICPLTMDIC
jgi:hypothetical protein